MKATGAIQALSGKIARNNKPYTIIELEDGQKIWCWDQRLLAGFNLGNLVEIEASDEQYPRLSKMVRSTIQSQTLLPFTTAPTPATPAQSGAPAAAFEKYENELASINAHIGQISATIQTIAGQVAKLRMDADDAVWPTLQIIRKSVEKIDRSVSDFLEEQAEKEAKE